MDETPLSYSSRIFSNLEYETLDADLYLINKNMNEIRSKTLPHSRGSEILEILTVVSLENQSKDEGLKIANFIEEFESEGEDSSFQKFSPENASCFDFEEAHEEPKASEVIKNDAKTLAFEAIMFSHHLFCLFNEDDESVPFEEGIERHLKLLEFLLMNKPLKSVLVSDLKFAQEAETKITPLNEEITPLTNRNLHHCYFWLGDHQFIEPPVSKTIMRALDFLQDGDAKYQMPEATNDDNSIVSLVKNVSKFLYTKLINLVKLEKNTIYYIKSRLNEIYSEVYPLPKEIKDLNRLREIAFDILNCIVNVIKKIYEDLFGEKDPFEKLINHDGVLELVELDQMIKSDKLDPRQLWKELLIVYDAFLLDIKCILKKKLSYGFDDKTDVFIEDLIQNPGSFLVSKQICQIDWGLIERLVEIYKTCIQTKKSAVHGSHFNLITANLKLKYCIRKNGKLHAISEPVYYRDDGRDYVDIYTYPMKSFNLEKEILENKDVQMLEKEFFLFLKANISKILGGVLNKLWKKQKKLEKITSVEFVINSSNCSSVSAENEEIFEELKKDVYNILSENPKTSAYADEIDVRKLQYYNFEEKMIAQDEIDTNSRSQISYFSYDFLKTLLTRTPYVPSVDNKRNYFLVIASPKDEKIIEIVEDAAKSTKKSLSKVKIRQNKSNT